MLEQQPGFIVDKLIDDGRGEFHCIIASQSTIIIYHI